MHQMTRTDQRNKKRRETEVQKRKRATTAAVVVALWRKWRNGVCVLSRLSTSPFFFSILPGVNWKRYKTIKQKKVHTKTITQRVSNKKERGLDQSSNRWLTSFNSPGRQVSRVVSDAIGGPVFFKNVFFLLCSLLWMAPSSGVGIFVDNESIRFVFHAFSFRSPFAPTIEFIH